jgi:tRNA 2-thiouridine synthesizing protein E
MPSTESQLNAFDDEGFLVDVGAWSYDLARLIAAEHGLAGLTQAHWAVICYLRRHYFREGTLPWESHICRVLGREKGCLHHLFGGPLTAWQVAGLPNPGEEARAYLLSFETTAPKSTQSSNRPGG